METSKVERAFQRLGLAIAFAVIGVIGISCVGGARAASDGIAVVVNVDRIPDARLPSLADVRAHSRTVVRSLRSSGYCVATDPSERIIAVTGPKDISDTADFTTDLPARTIAAAIVQGVTPRQFASRRKGYIALEDLSTNQRAAALRLAHRYGISDEHGVPKMPASRLVAGLWPSWRLHLCMQKDTGAVCRSLDPAIRPPSEAAIKAPPLHGSPLWFALPHRSVALADQLVSVDPGTYDLFSPLAKLPKPEGSAIAAEAGSSTVRLAVAADKVPLYALLWAIEVASGLEVRLGDPSAPASPSPLELEDITGPVYTLQPVPRVGYYWLPADPLRSGASKSTLTASLNATSDWLGWPLSDLPLLYRNQIQDAWQRLHKAKGMESPPLPSEQTVVIWTRALLLSVEAQAEDGSGGGIEIVLPVL